jgi:hypothetical protein
MARRFVCVREQVAHAVLPRRFLVSIVCKSPSAGTGRAVLVPRFSLHVVVTVFQALVMVIEGVNSAVNMITAVSMCLAHVSRTEVPPTAKPSLFLVCILCAFLFGTGWRFSWRCILIAPYSIYLLCCCARRSSWRVDCVLLQPGGQPSEPCRHAVVSPFPEVAFGCVAIASPPVAPPAAFTVPFPWQSCTPQWCSTCLDCFLPPSPAATLCFS